MIRRLMASLTVATFLLASCGLQNTSQQRRMTRTEAFDILETLPNEPASPSSVSTGGLEGAIQDALDSGGVTLPAGSAARTAVNTGSVDLSVLTQLVGLLQGGQATTLPLLATGLVNMNGGNPTTTGSKIGVIIQILTAVLPIIAMVAPRYAPIIQAVLVILPLIQSFITMFRRPTPTTA